MKKRIWMDTLALASITTTKKLDKIIDDNYTIIVANTAIDVAVFQDNLEWFK